MQKNSTRHTLAIVKPVAALPGASMPRKVSEAWSEAHKQQYNTGKDYPVCKGRCSRDVKNRFFHGCLLSRG